MPDEQKSIEDRVADLETLAMNAFHHGNAREGLWLQREAALKAEMRAMYQALIATVGELAMHAGIGRDDFERHFQARIKFFYRQHLEEIEDEDPGLAASLDTRPLMEYDLPEGIPPLFGPPPSAP